MVLKASFLVKEGKQAIGKLIQSVGNISLIVVEKMKEHYGIDIPSSTIRLITEKHAYKMANLKKIGSNQEEVLISETDGNMIPIVEMDPIKREAKQDSRKARKVSWKEVKLSFARGKDKVNRFYAGGIGTVEEAGQKMLECALLAGMREA